MSSALRDAIPRVLLDPAVAAGRAALRRLEDDDVPARLRKVAAYQGGGLPGPLTRALLRSLDEDDWLRAKAVDELRTTDTSAPGADGAAALFLVRPAGWEFELGRRVERLAAGASDDRAGDLDRQVTAARQRENEARRRVQEAKQRIEEVERAARREVEEVRAQLRELREADRVENARHAALVAELEAALRAAEEAHDREVKAGEALKQRLRRAEEQRALVERRIQSGSETAWGSGDPVALARHLDTLIRTVEADPSLLEFITPAAQRPWKLPPGARPDDRNAVDWLLRQPRPFTLVVDGYNVTFGLTGRPDAPSRARLNEELSRFKLRSKTPAAVVVVYDSAVNREAEGGPGPGGVRIQFTRDGLAADDEIRRLAAETKGPVVVVSSDREVREGSERHGAIALWSEALISWIQGR